MDKTFFFSNHANTLEKIELLPSTKLQLLNSLQLCLKRSRAHCAFGLRAPLVGDPVYYELSNRHLVSHGSRTVEICWWQGPDLIFQPSRQRCDMTFIYMILILLYGTFTLGVLAGPPCQSNRTLFIFRARPGPLWNFNFHNWREWDTSNYTIFFGGGM